MHRSFNIDEHLTEQHWQPVVLFSKPRVSIHVSMFVVHTSNGHGQNCTKRAIYRLGIDTLIANILVIIIIVPHRMQSVHKMWPIATDGVTLSVCLLVLFVSPACKNSWIDQHADWRADTGGPKEPRLGGVEIPTVWANMGVVRPIENDWVSVQKRFACTQQKIKTATARLRQPHAMLQTAWSVSLHCSLCGFSSKFFDHLKRDVFMAPSV